MLWFSRFISLENQERNLMDYVFYEAGAFSKTYGKGLLKIEWMTFVFRVNSFVEEFYRISLHFYYYMLNLIYKE